MRINVVKRAKKYLTPALGWDTELVVRRARGAEVVTNDKKRYLDFSCGTATTNVGHCHPKVISAAKHQINNLIHAGGVYHYHSIVKLCEELKAITPGDIDMFFFSNSGAEAIEGAMKLAKSVTHRPAVLCFRGAFHGRTIGCVSISSSNVKYRKDYEPMLPSVYRAPYAYCYRCPYGQKRETCALECIQFIRDVFKHEVHPEQTAAIIFEPVLGEGGYIVPPQEFVQFLRDFTREHGIMLIADEVQTGFGRTGRWFACEHFGIEPDIIVMAKGIASGFPLSALGAPSKIMKQWTPGAHGTTFGGNPVSCAASVATIQAIREERMLENCQTLSAAAFSRLKKMRDDNPIIGDVRGLGLMIGVEFIDKNGEPGMEVTEKVVKHCLESGLIVITCGTNGNVIRVIPPINISREQLMRGLDLLESAVAAVTHEEMAGAPV
jgi:4-aminobutyrate aminotransferase